MEKTYFPIFLTKKCHFLNKKCPLGKTRFLQKSGFLLTEPFETYLEWQISKNQCRRTSRQFFLNLNRQNREKYLKKKQNSGHIFFNPSFYMVFAYISIFRLCPPYRILTSPYKFKKPKSKNFEQFCPTLRFIWKSHSFQFLVYALPIGLWQVLINPKNTNLDQPYSTGASTELYLSILRKNHIPNFWAAVE